MHKKGLGETSEFCTYHPLVNMLFFTLVIGITMFSMSPYFMAVSLVGAWGYSILLKGKAALKFNLFMSVPMVLVMMVVNTFFNNNGETVLFYFNTSRVTLEALAFGFVGGLVLVAVVVWFSGFNVVMTADKLIYLFGKVAPVLGLTLSMIFRFIPLLKSRFAEISLGQKCMGRGHDQGNFIQRARQIVKEISILIAWSLEASIESADSMEARGYGLRGRTSFHLFKLTHRDYIALAAMAVTGIPVVIGCMMDMTNMNFFPKLIIQPLDLPTAALLICYLALTSIPFIIDIAGELKWKQLDLEM